MHDGIIVELTMPSSAFQVKPSRSRKIHCGNCAIIGDTAIFNRADS